MERKTFPAFQTKIDADLGVVEHIVAVMGNVDDGGDIIHNGAFTKTITERLGKIRVLDQHRTDSIMSALAKPMAMREMGRDELPPEMLQQFPDATGGLWAKTQFLMQTPEGKGAFERIKAGAVDEYSIGYDALDKDFEEITRNGEDLTVRNLRTIKLFEYSPVLWGMNEATSTLNAKESSETTEDEPEEAKPYGAVEDDGVWRVYKLDEDGQPTGEALGEHESQADAAAQIRALYAAEEDDEEEEEMESDGPQKGGNYVLSNKLTNAFLCEVQAISGRKGAAPNSITDDGFSYRLDVLKEERKIIVTAPNDPEQKVGRVLSKRNEKRIKDAVELLQAALAEIGEIEAEESAPGKAADNEPETKQAGPVEPPTSEDTIRLIEIEQQQIDLWR